MVASYSRVQLTVTQLTERLIASYARAGGINHLDGKNLPSKHAIADITVGLLRLLFPGFFDEKLIHSSEIKVETASLLDQVERAELQLLEVDSLLGELTPDVGLGRYPLLQLRERAKLPGPLGEAIEALSKRAGRGWRS